MENVLHIHSGDCAAGLMKKAGIGGDILVWRDILYLGPRYYDIEFKEYISQRAEFLSEMMDGFFSSGQIAEGLYGNYKKIENLNNYDEVTLWFDGCLFDQSMLVHILSEILMRNKSLPDINCQLICVGSYPDVERFSGLGQLDAGQFEELFTMREKITEEMFRFAAEADRIFAKKDRAQLNKLSELEACCLEFVPKAAGRLLSEMPGNPSEPGQLEKLVISAVKNGNTSFPEIFKYVSHNDELPIYWGDTHLAYVINCLAEKDNAQIRIDGGTGRLPQWFSGDIDWSQWKIYL